MPASAPLTVLQVLPADGACLKLFVIVGFDDAPNRPMQPDCAAPVRSEGLLSLLPITGWGPLASPDSTPNELQPRLAGSGLSPVVSAADSVCSWSECLEPPDPLLSPLAATGGGFGSLLLPLLLLPYHHQEVRELEAAVPSVSDLLLLLRFVLFCLALPCAAFFLSCAGLATSCSEDKPLPTDLERVLLRLHLLLTGLSSAAVELLLLSALVSAARGW